MASVPEIWLGVGALGLGEAIASALRRRDRPLDARIEAATRRRVETPKQANEHGRRQ